MTIYKCKEDFDIARKFFEHTYGSGTCKEGWLFKVEQEPTPEKKKYKLIQVNTKFPIYLYLRKSELNNFFEKIEVSE